MPNQKSNEKSKILALPNDCIANDSAHPNSQGKWPFAPTEFIPKFSKTSLSTGDRPFLQFPLRLSKAIAVGLLTLGLGVGSPHLVQADPMEQHAPPTGQTDPHHSPATEQTERFQPMEPPPLVKGVVTVVGLALIGLELWWFLFSRSKAE
ncbi:MAG: hypothetical protein VKK04_16735 [Synechococcales bacterium]|nr:hypothetical protein [Synechococcales bacterium]